MGVSLARESPDARAWLDEASRVTGIDVPRALERGGRVLGQTDILQPVLVAVSLSSAGARRDHPDVVAGHSLGELTSACWSASLPRAVAIDLAAVRGRAMAEAAAIRPGGMLAVHALTAAELAPVLEQSRAHGELSIAAHNAPDAIVVSGDEAAIAWLSCELSRQSTRLRVAGPWHSEAMRPAVEPYLAALRAAFAGRRLSVPVFSGCRVAEVGVSELPEVLAEGLVWPVRFVEVISALDEAGVDRAFLPEPARTTASLLRRAGARSWRLEMSARARH
jgi:[acyl-carrier-protein] S-malonyltransferase